MYTVLDFKLQSVCIFKADVYPTCVKFNGLILVLYIIMYMYVMYYGTTRYDTLTVAQVISTCIVTKDTKYGRHYRKCKNLTTNIDRKRK